MLRVSRFRGAGVCVMPCAIAAQFVPAFEIHW
jgi:hypothetical protein